MKFYLVIGNVIVEADSEEDAKAKVDCELNSGMMGSLEFDIDSVSEIKLTSTERNDAKTEEK